MSQILNDKVRKEHDMFRKYNGSRWMERGMKTGEERDGSKDVQRMQIIRGSYTKPRVLT